MKFRLKPNKRKHKRKLKKLSKSILVYTLVTCLLSGFFVSALSTKSVKADSSATDRITTFINLAAGKTIQDLDDGLNLTQDEMRFLGVYLSNFYIPFGTELGTTEEDKNSQTQKDMKKALQTDLKFSDDLAETFTSEVMGLSRSNCKELKFKVSKQYQKDYEDVPNFKVNYFNFLRLMLSQTKTVFEGYVVNDSKCPEIIKNLAKGEMGSDYTYGYFGYDKDGTFTPMFDCILSRKNTMKDNLYRTPSQIAFMQCLSSVSVKQGYGFSFFDFTKDEAKDDTTLSDMLKDMDEDAIYKMSAYGTTVNVDCFGNIILKGANHQYIAVPGCMNPYTWVTVDGNGKDYSNAGVNYNSITFMGLGLADSGKLFKKDSACVFDKSTPNKHIVKYRLQDNFMKDVSDRFEDKDGLLEHVPGFTQTVGGTITGYSFRMLRGSTDYKIKEKGFPIFGEDNVKYLKLVQKAENGFKAANSKDYSYYGSLYGGLNSDSFEDDSMQDKVGAWNTFRSDEIAIDDFYHWDLTAMGNLDGFVYIDNLGQFHFDNTQENVDLNEGVINILPYFNEKGEASKTKYFENWGKDSNNGFTNVYKEIQAGRLNTHMTADTAAIVGIYTAYAFAGLYQDDDSAKKNTIGKLGYRLNKDNMVSISNDPISIPSSVTDDLINKSIRNWIYYILHPMKGLDYFRILITNKLSALLVGWHNDMVGTNSVGATTGTTLYKSSTGYVTTPDLSEIEWTDSLISYYNNAIPFLMICMLVIMVFAYLTGVMSLQKGLFGVLVFSCFLLMPVNLINGVVSVSNRVTQNLYGERFTYWALVQQESYAEAIDKASSGDSYENYLKTLYATNNQVYSNQGSDSIVLKWQAPKKMASLMLTKEDRSLLDNLSSTNLLGLVLNNNAYSGESYLDKENSYMYRSYIDIGNFSRYIYHGLKNGAKSSRTTVSSSVISNTHSDFKKTVAAMGVDYAEDRNNGYSNLNGDDSNDKGNELRLIKPLSSKMYNDALSKKGKVNKLKMTDFVGINQDVFNFSIAMFNKSKNLKYKDELLGNCKEGNEESLKRYLDKYTDKDLSGLAAYSIMSESPFYYFSWSLYDQGMSTNSLASDGYRQLLLGNTDGGFFYNNSGNGELKDFMDMKSLFTYVIPYLREGNDLVREWDNIYGIKIYKGVPTEEGHWDDADIKNNKEMKQKYWHNINVARLYEIYTPWVDLMYDCSYANSENIKFLGKKYTIEDPINPASYPKERPMVFSESEMADYGLTKADLTKVEKKIIECNQDMQERMYDLLNYYNFNDLTLNTAAAINCTFAFNILFSENGIFKDNINLYPQSFELADFSYDAFLRFILSNTTNEDMTSKTDFYQNIVNNSSIATAVIMIGLDILSQYVLPAFKIFFLIAMFLSVIMLILVTAFRVDPQQKFIKKVLVGVIIPMAKFLAISLGFAYVISLFMGTGNNAVTQSDKVSISMGDPVVVMLAMIAVNIGAIVLYFFTIKGVIKDIKHNFKLATSFTGGVFGGVLATLGGLIAGSKLASKVRGGSSSGGSSAGSGSVKDSGTGRESTRASRRASENSAEGRQEDEPRTRVNDVKRETFKQSDSKKDKVNNEEKKQDINEKTSRGVNRMNESSRNRTADRFSSNRVKDDGRNKK